MDYDSEDEVFFGIRSSREEEKVKDLMEETVFHTCSSSILSDVSDDGQIRSQALGEECDDSLRNTSEAGDNRDVNGLAGRYVLEVPQIATTESDRLAPCVSGGHVPEVPQHGNANTRSNVLAQGASGGHVPEVPLDGNDTAGSDDLMIDNLPYYILESLEAASRGERNESGAISCSKESGIESRPEDSGIDSRPRTSPAVIVNTPHCSYSQAGHVSTQTGSSTRPRGTVSKFKTPTSKPVRGLCVRGKYDHVVSPVARYIWENPAPPLFQNVEGRLVKSLKIKPPVSKENAPPLSKGHTGSSNSVLLPTTSYKPARIAVVEKDDSAATHNSKKSALSPFPATVIRHTGHARVPKSSVLSENAVIDNTSNTTSDGTMMEVSMIQIKPTRKPFN